MVNGEGSGSGALSQAALGRALDLSAPAITKLKKQGMPVHSVAAAQQWRQDRQNVAQRKPWPGRTAPAAPAAPAAPPAEFVHGESHDAARTRREIAEADLAELKLGELHGELVRAADVRASYARRLASLRESLLQIPARLAPIVASETDQAACHETLQSELHAVLEQIST